MLHPGPSSKIIYGHRLLNLVLPAKLFMDIDCWISHHFHVSPWGQFPAGSLAEPSGPVAYRLDSNCPLGNWETGVCLQDGPAPHVCFMLCFSTLNTGQAGGKLVPTCLPSCDAAMLAPMGSEGMRSGLGSKACAACRVLPVSCTQSVL